MTPAPSTPVEGTPARDVAEAVDSCPGCEAPLWPDNLTSCWNCGQALIDYGPKFRTPPPGEGAGRPLPEFQMVACADHMLTGHRWRCRACRREVERQFQECCEEMWRLQRTTPPPPPVGEERRPVDGGERSQSEQWFVVHHNQIRSLRFGTFPIERLARAWIAACTCGPHTLRHTVTTTYTASTTEEFVAAAADRGDRA